MTKLLRLIPLLFILLVACADPAFQQGEFSADCSWVYDDTGSVVMTCYPTLKTPLATPVTPTATTTPQIPTNYPTATPTPNTTPAPQWTGNLFINGGFEGTVRPIVFPEINVFTGWEVFYCAEFYVPTNCPAPAAGNEPGLLMRRAEFKPSDVPNRVASGKTSQAWFGFYGVTQGGVSQTVDIPDGATICEVSVNAQIWNAEDAKGACVTRDSRNRCVEWSSDPYTSDRASEDDRSAAWFQIKVDADGGTFAFANDLLVSQKFGYHYNDGKSPDTAENGHGLYDQFELISFSFEPVGRQATIFFEGMNKYPKTHNDFYLDTAKVKCLVP